MKDIDFDELDRAVSSVLGQKTTNATADSNGTADKKDDLAPTQEPATDNVVSTVDTTEPTTDVAAASEPVSPKPATTPLAIKRRGKFMDVMHPSADMKPVGAASVKPVRPKPVLTPLLTEEAESTVEHTAEPTASLDESHSLIGAEPTPVTETLPETVEHADADNSPAEETAAPSSLDVDTTDSPVVAEDNTNEQAGESTQDDAPEATLDDAAQPDNPAPQATPFLSDTQVEKRPLGAFGEADAAEESAGSPAAADELATTAQPADMQSTPVVSLPRELQPDVVGVESVQATETLEAPATSTSPFAANVPVAPEASDGRVEGHPLFDTSTYHEPIAAVHQSGMPGWAKWLIGLAACLAIGAGVGYFLFTAGL